MAQSTVNGQNIKCSSCGGTLVFDPVTQKMKCEYCDSEFDIENEGTIHENDINQALDAINKNKWNDVKILKCNSCGAEVVIENAADSTKCSFCGSNHVVKIEELPGIVPEGVIPFLLTKDEAVKRFKKVVRKKFFAPKEIKQMNPENIKGVYIPYWTYDAIVHSTYNVEAGTYYYVPVTKTRKVNGKRETYIDNERRTRWEWRSGSKNLNFDDVLVNASNADYINNLYNQDDFDFKKAQPYNTNYLTGFEVKRPSVSVKEGFQTARNIMQNKLESSIKGDIHSDTYRNLDVDSSYYNVTYKLMLAPTWVIGYKYKGKSYQSTVDAQNGVVKGKIPKSIKKIASVIGAGVAAFIVLITTVSVVSSTQYSRDMKLVNTYIANQEYTDAMNVLSDKVNSSCDHQEVYTTYAKLYIEKQDYRNACRILKLGKKYAYETDEIDTMLEQVKPLLEKSNTKNLISSSTTSSGTSGKNTTQTNTSYTTTSN